MASEWTSYAVCRHCKFWTYHSDLAGPKCRCGSRWSKGTLAKAKRARGIREDNVPSGEGRQAANVAVPQPSNIKAFNDLLGKLKSEGVIDVNFVGPEIAPAPDTSEPVQTPIQRLGKANNRLIGATRALSKASARINSVDEEIANANATLEKLKQERATAIEYRQEKQQAVKDIGEEIKVASEAHQAQLDQEAKAAKETTDSEPKVTPSAASKRPVSETNEGDDTMAACVKKALEQALKERKPPSSPEQMDSDEPPEMFLEAIREIWSKAVAKHQEPADESKDKHARTG